ncbi:P-loop containing nucleoside triphosphate hydrolase protein [Ascobolus immersus RN42]|uniref:P-loop containing nucleoside triphosphate hydrolase protein n=1 Tax=Ascobolus immersus RN42 TaxID=1160509 RepID=A0A3N4IH34_ASCIM|nr:P-loop containing nucleoside triphosphate hydrolase protein [Ascobolus immersus RN42]
MDEKKLQRLNKRFNDVLRGREMVQKAPEGRIFLEAICEQKDPSVCIEKLGTSTHALKAIRFTFRSDLSPTFIIDHACRFFRYFYDPSLKQLGNGQFFKDVMEAILDPPSFFHAFTNAFKAGQLKEPAVEVFAWLLLECLSIFDHEDNPEFLDIAKEITDDATFIKSESKDIRTFGQKIKHAVDVLAGNAPGGKEGEPTPGGRHDNDHVDFRAISILPTADELASTEDPFIRRVEYLTTSETEERPRIHLDNQFRLNRDDFLAELRNDLRIASQKYNATRRSQVLRDCRVMGISCGTEMRRKPFALRLSFKEGLPNEMKNLSTEKRRDFLKNPRNRSIIAHGAVACLTKNGQPVAFGSIERDIDLLAVDQVIVEFTGKDALFQALLALMNKTVYLELVVVNTAFFACEPILQRLQDTSEINFPEELLFMERQPIDQHEKLLDLIEKLNSNPQEFVQDVASGIKGKDIRLDGSQIESINEALNNRVSLIQGPPGTGKSFVGALLVKSLYDATHEKILVLCYTNHALDQFLEDLIKIGIPADDILRLGKPKATNPVIDPLTLFNAKSTYRMPAARYQRKNDLEKELGNQEKKLNDEMVDFMNVSLGKGDLMDFLQFEDTDFYDAFQIPESKDGSTTVGKGGKKKVGPDYLINRWKKGEDAGFMKNRLSPSTRHVWELNKEQRSALWLKWHDLMVEESALALNNSVKTYNDCVEQLREITDERDVEKMRSKRIIGCTTTAAAKYAKGIQASRPGILLVEEAGEVLESHVLTAMGPSTNQLILIGDHKQLRPKANNYKLSVEKGDGFDLNRSLFERMVLGGYPHTTLASQHRMCPEISALVRHLTYPTLIDAPSTQDRPPLRGFQNRVMFVHHERPEKDANRIAERRSKGEATSKENDFEAEMVLKCVRYLAQQGYGTDNIVILTPYLGQLLRLKEILEKDHDPILNDLDFGDLVQAGLVPAATANLTKKPIRIATIDNYQGEESDIVISTLTRSNAIGDIGFMAAPERLNVLLSRARDALILIGNVHTFLKSPKGKPTWEPFIDLLKDRNQIFDGFPVKCERHPHKTALLARPEDFMEHCPDGGCKEPCGTKLICGKHDCPSSCHQISDHSKMQCNVMFKDTCSEGHKLQWRCYQNGPPICRKCEWEAEEKARKQKRDFELQEERDRKQKEYAKALEELDAKMEAERQRLADSRLDKQQRDALAQKKKDLEALKARTTHEINIRNAQTTKPVPSASVPSAPSKQPDDSDDPNTDQKTDDNQTASAPPPDDATQQPSQEPTKVNSPAFDEWEDEKTRFGAVNEHLDDLMKMIGLEEVKQKFLRIKAKVDISIRQGTDLKNERFGAALLGNPGTGKTTVARIYAKFLTSFGILPGDTFLETTGSRLANDGVDGCKKMLEKLLNAGGGALFIDEAYQLVNGNSGGTQVLDFLLAEVENQTGKLVFILAGYNKQMEKFFMHNPGIPSRFPHAFQFEDYTDKELCQILRKTIDDQFSGQMAVEEGMDGRFLRVVATRVGRGRGKDGFGNARAIQNMFSIIRERQAHRVKQERRKGNAPDDFFLTKEDLIGPEPSRAIEKSEAWTELQQMIGLKSVKSAVGALLEILQTNYERELQEKPIIECTLNKVFTGNPGTGKTTIAKLYGRILADLGLLSTNEVVIKNPSDFVGAYIGHSEANTKGILESTIGKVLVIDEAYALFGGGGNDNAQGPDSFKTAVIDTLVAEVQSTPGDDRCVLLLGYRDKIENMFQKVNPGLARRFPLASAFDFEDFTAEELGRILDLKLKRQGFSCTNKSRRVAMDCLERARKRPNFGNGGEIDILLDKAKLTHQKRRTARKTRSLDVFDPEDFDENYNRGERAAMNCKELFKDDIDAEEVVQKLEGYQRTAQKMRKRGLKPETQIPFNFRFVGPPGTGKTTTARKMGQVFYDMGFLATPEVILCSATELVGQWVGHTGPKTQAMLDKALGRVLLIDEAYRLGEGQFAKEAMDEIVTCLTLPKYMGKMITILAGYDTEIKKLMQTNPGLESRFPEEIFFASFSPASCVKILRKELALIQVDAGLLDDMEDGLKSEVHSIFNDLAKLPAWGNARDVQNIAKAIYRNLLDVADPDPTMQIALTEDILLANLRGILHERVKLQSLPPPQPALKVPEKPAEPPVQLPPVQQPPVQTAQASSKSPPTASAASAQQAPPPRKAVKHKGPQDSGKAQKNAKVPEPKQDSKESSSLPKDTDIRDAGVTDDVWNQLQIDKAKAEARRQELEEIEKDAAKEEALIKKKLEDERKAYEDYVQKKNDELKAAKQEHQDKIKRELEQERLRVLERKRQHEEKLRREEAARKKAEEARKREALAQKKLRNIGVCPVGYRWIKQAGGYRCAGGSHVVTDAQLGM